jgi:hypothetical protein
MRPQSAKAKGRRLQQWVRDTLLAFCPALTPDDIRSTSMGAAGEDILLSPAARQVYPFSIEAKCQESLNVWAALEQAENNVPARGFEFCTPIVVFKRNHSKTYVALEFEQFLRLTRK